MEYGGVRSAKLTFKGDKKSSHKKKKHKKEKRKRESDSDDEKSGWRAAKDSSQLKGTIAIRWSDGTFLGAKDNGGLALWKSEEDPLPEAAQIFTVIRPSDSQIAFKSGYGKFIGIDGSECKLVGLSEAVGQLELWEPVFQDGKAALLSAGKNNFVTSCRGELFASCPKVKGDNETCSFLIVYDQSEQACKKSKIVDPKKIARKAGLSKDDIRNAESSGISIYEAILDKRSKHKSDKFCK